MTLAVIVLLVAGALKLCASAFLDWRNIVSVRRNAGEIPEMFRSFIDLSTYSKSADYTQARLKFSVAESVFGFALLAVLLVCGAFPEMFGGFVEVFGGGVWAQSFAIIAVMSILAVPSLPFEFYEQFVIEQKFGFNKSTVGLWVADKIKGFLVGVVLCAPILAVILYFAGTFETWWLWGFVAVAVFQVVMIVVYPMFIIPLFNKLKDLEDGELKNALFDVAKRGKFFAKTIQVIDGSRRSSHSNAYFTGFGKFRRIVLFDTLLEQLDQSELEAVLAHEIGHYRKGHIYKMMAASFAMTFAMFAVMGYIARCDWFYAQFGFEKSWGLGSVLLMYALFSGAFTFWLAPLVNLNSRKHEYEADAFAARLCGGGRTLVSALKKLHMKNLGNLTPDRLYSAFHYSHPTLSERMGALSKFDTENEKQ